MDIRPRIPEKRVLQAEASTSPAEAELPQPSPCKPSSIAGIKQQSPQNTLKESKQVQKKQTSMD